MGLNIGLGAVLAGRAYVETLTSLHLGRGTFTFVCFFFFFNLANVEEMLNINASVIVQSSRGRLILLLVRINKFFTHNCVALVTVLSEKSHDGHIKSPFRITIKIYIYSKGI